MVVKHLIDYQEESNGILYTVSWINSKITKKNNSIFLKKVIKKEEDVQRAIDFYFDTFLRGWFQKFF